MNAIRTLVAAIAIGGALAQPVVAASVKADHVEVELVAETLAATPGQMLSVALRIKHDRGWHTYWRNPGDSGLATRIEWNLPSGFAPGPIEWPVPKRIPVPPLANYGYEGEVLLPVQVGVPKSAFLGDVVLKARVDWLVCKEICIPGGADLTLRLPLVLGSPAPDPRWASPIAAARAAVPGDIKGWATTAMGKGNQIEVTLTPAQGRVRAPKSLYFFAADGGLVEPSGIQSSRVDGDTLRLVLPVAADLRADTKQLSGILVSDPPLAGNAAAVAIEAPLSGQIVPGKPGSGQAQAPPLAEAAGTTSGGIGLLFAVLLAFVGGLLLNLMPCVFPVLSIKILGFVDQAHGDRSLLQVHALAYGAGVVLSFIALAGGLIALRAGGEAIGWGFQLQSPWVVAALAALFFLLALNLSGVFEILVPLPETPVRPARHPVYGSFASGVLAAVVASPCTAPFMGAALGYAVTQSALSAIVVFATLGLGMALPYILLAWFPAWMKRLPRPGRWLADLKQLLAFPLYGTVVWLGWVLGQQVGVDGLARLGAGLVALGLAAWLWGGAQRGGHRFRRLLAGLVTVAGLYIGFPWPGLPAESAPSGVGAQSGAEWPPFSRDQVDSLLNAGRPVFVDFTAAWCVTCQVNKKLVLDRRGTLEAFSAKSVALLRADWTRRDPEITSALAGLGRSGVPVYVLYRPGKAPLVLPEVLREHVIREALATL